MGKTVSALTLVLAAVSGSVAPRAEAAITDGYTRLDFQLSTAADLFDICTVDSAHTDYPATHGFCLGYVAGGRDYQRAITADRISIRSPVRARR